MRTVLLAAALLFGCGDSGGGADMALDMSVVSCCGNPGDTGNSYGVGMYCTKLADCAGNTKANICTTIASTKTFFCTLQCDGTDAGASNQCGMNATCLCQTGGCGCVPTSCVAQISNPACQ